MQSKIFSVFQIIIYFFILTSNVNAQDDCVPWDARHLSSENLIVGRIIIKANNIFDTSIRQEQNRIHRVANMLHIQTREDTIKIQLLFKSGDAYDARLIEETVRNIRSNRYINSVAIKPVYICGNKVEILVQTTDNWTLTPSISVGYSGGISTSGFNITEENLLGLGKSISIGYSSGVDRNESSINYYDPQFNGTRNILSLSAQNNSDGEGYGLKLGLPFYQLNSKKSWGTSLSSKRQITPVYNNALVTSEIGQKDKSASLYYGWSDGLHNKRVNRTSIGWLYRAADYSGINGSTPSIDSYSLSYPWIEHEDFSEDYIQRVNFRTMGRIEDISLGRHITTRLGLLHESLGSSDNYLYLSGRYSKGFHPGKNQLSLLSFGIETYVGEGFLKGSNIDLKGEWFWQQGDSKNYYMLAKYNMIDNLLPGEQVVLGGRTGLRGYPLRYQTGDKSLLLTIEKQFFFKWYPYNLFKFGAVIFGDVGSAWGQGNSQKFIADVGLGLRFVSTRSTGSSVLHLDLALPYNAAENIDNYQIRITAEKTL